MLGKSNEIVSNDNMRLAIATDRPVAGEYPSTWPKNTLEYPNMAAAGLTSSQYSLPQLKMSRKKRHKAKLVIIAASQESTAQGPEAPEMIEDQTAYLQSGITSKSGHDLQKRKLYSSTV